MMDSMSSSFLRPIVIFAGIFGIVQSLIWISISITGLVAFYCNMNLSGTTTSMYHTIGLTLFHMYFHGECTQENLAPTDFSVLEGLSLMRPVDIHAWVWVYLMISFFWLISSCTMLSHVKSKYIVWANIFLYFWIAITLAILILDLALAILFGLDYDRIMVRSYAEPLIPGTTSNVLIAAQAAAGIMFSVVLRGYIIWIINATLVIYLFTQTLRISDYNRMTPLLTSGISNGGYSEDDRRQHPIEAYVNRRTQNLWYNAPEQPQPRSTSMDRPRTLYDERKQYYNNSQSLPKEQRRQPLPVPVTSINQKYQPTQRHQDNSLREFSGRNSSVKPPPQRNDHSVPDPDYSPPMQRVNPFDNRPVLRSALRSSRF